MIRSAEGGTWRFYHEITGWVEKQGLGTESQAEPELWSRSWHTSMLTQSRAAVNMLLGTQRVQVWA